MDRQIINTGTEANDHTGDSIRVAFGKVNANFSAVWDGSTVIEVTDAARTATVEENQATFTNRGAIVEVDFILPDAAAGLRFTFVNRSGYNLRISPSGLDTISLPDGLETMTGDAGGYVKSETQADTVTLLCDSSSSDGVGGKWVAIAITGQFWTVN